MEVDGDQQTFKEEELLKHMDQEIVTLQEYGVEESPVIIRRLLNLYRWDQQRALEAYFEGVKNVPPPKPVVPQSNDCLICFTRCSRLKLKGGKCGHKFCSDCWRGYLEVEILDTGRTDEICCPAVDCNWPLDDSFVLKLLKQQHLKDKYRRLILNGFVQRNRCLRWCSNPKCDCAIKIDDPTSELMVCHCGQMSCFKCGDEFHESVTCDLLRTWNARIQSDGPNWAWIAVNAKPCPKCKVFINKNGGCNHMKCTQCHSDFCWMCEKIWTNSQGCKCYTYQGQPATQKEGEDELARKKTELHRWGHYYERFSNHGQSRRLEKDLDRKIEEKVARLEKLNKAYSYQMKFLFAAVKILQKCRTALMYSYVFAFYLGDNPQKHIFEDNLKDLQNAVETLSQKLERTEDDEIDEVLQNIDIDEMRCEIQDKMTYCDQRRIILAEHVREGIENDLWVFVK